MMIRRLASAGACVVERGELDRRRATSTERDDRRVAQPGICFRLRNPQQRRRIVTRAERRDDLVFHALGGGRVDLHQLVRDAGPPKRPSSRTAAMRTDLRTCLGHLHDGRARFGTARLHEHEQRAAGVVRSFGSERDVLEHRDDLRAIGANQAAERLDAQIGVRHVALGHPHRRRRRRAAAQEGQRGLGGRAAGRRPRARRRKGDGHIRRRQRSWRGSRPRRHRDTRWQRRRVAARPRRAAPEAAGGTVCHHSTSLRCRRCAISIRSDRAGFTHRLDGNLRSSRLIVSTAPRKSRD